MDLGQMQTKVRKVTGDRLASGIIEAQDAFIAGAINDVIIPDFVGRHDWFFKEAFETVALGQGEITLEMTSTLQDVKLLILRTGDIGTTKPLQYKPMQRFFELFPDPILESPTFPSMYTWVNRTIHFDCPAADDWDVALIGLRRFPTLVNPTDTPSWLDDDKHMLLVFGATGFVYQTCEDTKNAAVWLNLYEQGVESWWNQREAQGDAQTHIGRFRSGPKYPSLGDYWLNPFVRSVEAP